MDALLRTAPDSCVRWHAPSPTGLLPKPRQHRLELSADADRRDLASKAGLIVGLDRDARYRRFALGGLQPLDRQFAQEAVDRLFLSHADHRIVIAAHPGIAHIGGAAGQDLVIGGRYVGVGADDE